MYGNHAEAALAAGLVSTATTAITTVAITLFAIVLNTGGSLLPVSGQFVRSGPVVAPGGAVRRPGEIIPTFAPVCQPPLVSEC